MLTLTTVSLSGQSRISGRVTDSHGNPLLGTTLFLIGTKIGAVSDNDGYYTIKATSERNIKLKASYLGFKTQIIDIVLKKGQDKCINIQLEENSDKLQEVVIVGKSQEQLKRESPITTAVVDIKKIQSQSISLPQIMNQVSGVRVRKNGGVGSSTDISINGLHGDAIRFFRDAIPLDYLGNAFNLSLLPIDQIANIEIYKGILPTELGADALGGAVNLVSRKSQKNNLAITYSIGSFNTNQVSVNGYLSIPKTKLFVDISSYYVAADNNYKIQVEMADDVTGNLKKINVKRFHGGVESGFMEVKTGVKNTKIADLFEVGIVLSNINKQRQNDIRMQHVFGEVMYYEDSRIFTTHYKKKFKKLNLDIFGAYSKLKTINDDTPAYSYNWLGEATPYDSENHTGESGLSQSYKTLHTDYMLVRINLSYKIGANSRLDFNHNLTNKKRTGSDPYATLYDDNLDILSIPAKYVKQVSSIGLTSNLLSKRITNIFTLKRYQVNTRSVASVYDYYGDPTKVSDTNYGIANSIKYNFNNDQYIRVSYEKATRIPDAGEYLGKPESDILGNPDLTPERSDNINIGGFTKLNKTLWLDLNAFYRYIKGQIVLQNYTLYQSKYQNTDDTQVLGTEFTLKGKPTNSLAYNISLTYQDIRRKNIQDVKNKLLLNARRPNIPYFFGNIGLRYSPTSPFVYGLWQIYGNYTYVEQYLLNSIPKSEEPSLFGKADSDANIIPTQNVVDLGVTYRKKGLPISINLELNNILNTKTYDGFRVQKPGINFRLKLKYLIN